MAAGRRLGKATTGRYLLQDDGRAVTEQGDRRAGRWQLAGQRTDRKLERRRQGDSRAADRATAGRAGQHLGAAAGRCSATSGATARRDATAERGRTCAVARQGDGQAGRRQDGGGGP